MKAATHNGHCQVCGRLQALPPNAAGRGLLSLHGYTVKDFGFFNGVCGGARHLPLQQERTIADRIIAQLRDYAAREERAAEDLKNGVTDPKRAKSGKRVLEIVTSNGRQRKQWSDEYVDYADAPAFHQQAARDGLIFKHEREARNARIFAKDLKALADKIHGTALIPVEPESGSRVAKAGDKIRMNDLEVELVKRIYIEPRGFSRRGSQGWLVRLDNGRTFEVADAQITRALKKA